MIRFNDISSKDTLHINLYGNLSSAVLHQSFVLLYRMTTCLYLNSYVDQKDEAEALANDKTGPVPCGTSSKTCFYMCSDITEAYVRGKVCLALQL